MSKIKADTKLRNSCMNAECFHPKIQVIDLCTALECVHQATEEGRKASDNWRKKYRQEVDALRSKAVLAFAEVYDMREVFSKKVAIDMFEKILSK